MVLVRNAAINDLPAMLEIYNEIIANTTAVWDYDPHTADMREQWFITKQEQGFPVFVAEENGKVAGFSSIGPFRTWAGYKHTVENSIYVAANSRGKGIGKLLLKPLIDESKRLGIHAIVAGIDAVNESSIKLHQQFGFVEVAHFKEVGYKFGRWMDLKFLELIV